MIVGRIVTTLAFVLSWPIIVVAAAVVVTGCTLRALTEVWR
jgi:hypothetical protein